MHIVDVNNNKNIEFDGGFTIRGRNLYGSGTINNLSKLKLSYDGKEILVAESIGFIINDEGVTSDKARIKFSLDFDSIVHPACNLVFAENTKTLTLSRGEDGILAAPFYNSYHKLDMYVETLSWKLGEPSINFSGPKGTKTIKTAQFASLNFFDVKSYDNLNTRKIYNF